MRILSSISFCIALMFSFDTFATAQYGDILIDGKDTVEIFSNPLESYLDIKGTRTINDYELTMTSTACYRGYRATWEIKNDSLFLIKIMKGCSSWGDEEPESFNLENEFGSREVFAKWVNSTLYSPRGELVQYVHAGYASIYEKEKYIRILNGKVDSIEFKNNIIYEQGRIKPIERSLSDTIEHIIISHIDTSSISKFEDKEVCSISIKFDSEGRIDTIKNEYTYDGISFFEQTIHEVATEALKDFPLLMKVNHERYDFTYVSISINSHCVKYPDDYEYGCGR